MASFLAALDGLQYPYGAGFAVSIQDQCWRNHARHAILLRRNFSRPMSGRHDVARLDPVAAITVAVIAKGMETMHQIALNARVVCLDGPVGKCSHLVFLPGARTLTHFVVSGDTDAQWDDRIVPLEMIIGSDESVINLNCTREEVAALPAFSDREFVAYSSEEYMASSMMMSDPYTMPMYIPVNNEIVHENIPEGLRAIRYGTVVEATDGPVGSVDQLLLDPETSEITHFTLQEDHLWGKAKVITLPLTAVDHADENTVYLKLDKASIAVLPAIKGGKKGDSGERPGRVELIAKVFDAPEKAAESLEFVRSLERAQHGALKIRNSAIIIKDAQGKVTVTEPSTLSRRKGRWMGAVAGGLLGALAGPVGIVIGAAAGAGIGHTSPKWFDLGLPDEFLTRLQGRLTPSSSALVLVVDHTYSRSLKESLSSSDGFIMETTLTDEVVAQLLDEQEK